MPAVLVQRSRWLLERKTAIDSARKGLPFRRGETKSLPHDISAQTPATYGSAGLHSPCCILGSKVRNKFADNRMIILFLNSMHPAGKGIADFFNHVHHIFFVHIREKRQGDDARRYVFRVLEEP